MPRQPELVAQLLWRKMRVYFQMVARAVTNQLVQENYFEIAIVHQKGAQAIDSVPKRTILDGRSSIDNSTKANDNASTQARQNIENQAVHFRSGPQGLNGIDVENITNVQFREYSRIMCEESPGSTR
jgi:hypothetical protein